MPDLELKDLYEEMQRAFKALQERMTRSEEEVKKFGSPTGDTKAAIEKIQDHLDELEKKMQEKLDQIETKINRPNGGGPGDRKGKDQQLSKEAFLKYCRKDVGALTADEVKALSTDSDPDGGYAVPSPVRGAIIEKLIQISPIRALATVETITQGNAWEAPTEGATEFAGGWVAERGSRPETTSAKLGLEQIPVHEMYANPRATQTMLDDNGFAFEEWLTRRVSTTLAKLEGTAFVSGDGVGKPEGILTKSGISEVVSGAAAAITADGLIDLAYALPELYANNATWIMRRTSIRDIRKLKDSNNQYLWQPGLAGTSPAMILDRPYIEAPDMPAIAANAYAIAFGDFRNGYKIIDRQQIRVLRDPYSAKPYIEFYTTRRTGGQVVLAEAFVKQKISA